MRTKKRRNSSLRPIEDSLSDMKVQTGIEPSARLPSDYSHTNPKIVGIDSEIISAISIDYQLTVRPKVELNRYQCSMLLETLLVKVRDCGINLSLYLILEFLYSRLLGSKTSPEYLRDVNERRVTLLAQLLLRSIRGMWLTLDCCEQLSEDLKRDLFELYNLFPSMREFHSRVEYWKPERFLEVRAVRLDVFLERGRTSEPYSSYCKGYGESSRMGRRQKTSYSAELDGEEDYRTEITFTSVSELQLLLDLVRLDTREKFRKMKENR